MLWQQRGGRGDPTWLLLHGLGATGAVWDGLCRELDRMGRGQWLVVDLPGHGHSQALADYSVGAMTAAVAAVLDRDRAYRVIAHSLGVYVGLALASGWFGARIASLLGVGPKVTWSEPEVASMIELARKPAKVFATEEEAWARYRKVSGLDAVAPGTATLARGVMMTEGGFRLAADPRTPLVAGAPFDTLAASARCPFLLARGVTDPMMTLDELRRYSAAATDIAGTGHNAHVQAPAAVLELADGLARRAG
jgi:pimeloyl-ACP methyl ester carboxylesterase